ncbi:MULTISPECIES: response regulator transcription factor [Microbacterium]|uniref:DNA-binding response OmpR family regulator n=1 Tax=Microbacterium lacticum TaxID=33885 RepID=A0A4Y3UN70_9MICO|nr:MULTISPECIES: response regulator transcription factor [Microbacterium]MBF9336079.1 response regulator transcription factor [Microbacterium lacticum]MCC9054077.1 response regulator transcription factor [Microbacterium sp. F2E]TQN00908.1 DNA-binding response OmpR family regulator [Microbacterium lacticum]GEB94365.1 DNA-binding response regulator [Microbacterium lacticum]GGN16974.1 DNA-binding response regulator [Microbacterium lacticum]
MTRILVVDDEPHILALVTRALHADGHETVVAEDGQAALDRALEGDIDLVILDVGLPSLDGFEVLRALRAGGERMPVIMLTARSSTSDAVDGLDAGASDYVPKPFSVAELMARVRSRLRERTGAVTMVLSQGDVTLDILARRTTVAGREVDLSAREFALAEQFLRHPGAVLTREVLLSRIWGMDFDPGSNVVDVYVRYLRAKLGADHIVTVRGEGYRWE